MSNSLFFSITAVYMLWVAISGAKAKQKRDIDATKLSQPGLTGIDKITLTENASLSNDDGEPLQHADPQFSFNDSYRDTPVSSDTSEHNADLKNITLAYERKQRQVV